MGGDYWTAVAADRQMRARQVILRAREDSEEERDEASMRGRLHAERQQLKLQILEFVSGGTDAPQDLEERLYSIERALD